MVCLCDYLSYSHRHAYHQEDLLLLLANLPLKGSTSNNGNKGNSYRDKGDEEEYCNLNRVAWGSKEDPSFLWLRHSWHGLQASSSSPSPSPMSLPVDVSNLSEPSAPDNGDNDVSSQSKEKYPLPSGRGPGGWIEPWLGPLLNNSSTGNERRGDTEDGASTLLVANGIPPLVERCCAQFLVSRELVRRRPKAFYQAALDQVGYSQPNISR